tara:strand:- start:470 stop:880 length:411 start_codon:yes stop_codon:yes gene_type:complete
MQQEKTTYTNKELVSLLQGLHAVQNLAGLKFALRVSKNIKILRDELEDLEKAATPSAEFVELSRKVGELEQKKDMDAIAKLEKDNKKLVDARKKQLAELEEVMKDETEVNLVAIYENMLPKDITAAQLTGIQTLIK